MDHCAHHPCADREKQQDKSQTVANIDEVLPPLDPGLEEECQALVDCGMEEDVEEKEKGGPVHLVGNLKRMET